MRKYFTSIFYAFIFLICSAVSAQQEARLLRFPAIHGNSIVFTYAGDLYTVSAAGGIARKLTNDAAGFEMFAKFSPDGKQIAFTGQYDGNTEVYSMPAEGGIPKRLSYTANIIPRRCFRQDGSKQYCNGMERKRPDCFQNTLDGVQ